MPNEVAMTNSNGAGMNLRRSTERTIGAERASVKIADTWTTGKAPFITAGPRFITSNPIAPSATRLVATCCRLSTFRLAACRQSATMAAMLAHAALALYVVVRIYDAHG